MSTLQRRIVLVVVIAIHLALDLAAVPIIVRWKLSNGSGFGWSIISGALVGQLAVLAAYWAVGPGHWLRRSLWACFLVVLVWYAVTAGAVSTGNSFEVASIEQVLAVVMTLSFLFLAIAHWIVGPIARSRVQSVSRGTTSGAAFIPRFRVAHLLVLTVAVAVVCVIAQSRSGRALLDARWSFSNGDWGIFLGVTALWSALAAAISIPAAWVCLREGRLVRRLWFFCVYAVVVAAMTSGVAYAFWGESLSAISVACIPLLVACEVVGCGIVLRRLGYRLEREDRNETATPD
jgi:hypothetical protein